MDYGILMFFFLHDIALIRQLVDRPIKQSLDLNGICLHIILFMIHNSLYS